MDTDTPSSNSTRRPSSFVPRLIWVVVSMFLILMLVIGIAWLALNPHQPGFRVSSLSVSNFTASESQLEGHFDIGLTLSNPNKKIVVFLDEFSVSVCYGNIGLSRATVRPVYLGRTREKDVKVELVMKESPELVHKVSADLGRDWGKGVVNFNVQMQLRTKFVAGIWPAREKFYQVSCGDLDVGFVSSPKENGKLLGVGRNCRVSPTMYD